MIIDRRVIYCGFTTAFLVFLIFMLVMWISMNLSYGFYQKGALEIAQNHSLEERDFIKNLIMPGTSMYGAGVSCCNQADCHITEEDMENGHYKARLGRIENGEWVMGPWVVIPDDRVIHFPPKVGRHPGHPILCERSSFGNNVGAVYGQPGRSTSAVESPTWINLFCYLPGAGL